MRKSGCWLRLNMRYKIITLTEDQINILIYNKVKEYYSLGLAFKSWKKPYEMTVLDQRKWMLAKIKYGL
jgi:hypothetical protein